MLQAIETVYRGIRFRSRTEARIAVFLQELRAEWHYEPEGLHMPHSGNYLPDFWVTGFPVRPFGRPPGKTSKVSFWLEVKGAQRTCDEATKLRELACATGDYGYFAYYSSLQNVVDSCCPKNIQFFGGAFSSGAFSDVQCPHSVFRPVGGFPGEKLPLTEKGTLDWAAPEVKSFYAELHSKLDNGPFPACGCDASIWLPAAKSALAHRFGT